MTASRRVPTPTIVVLDPSTVERLAMRTDPAIRLRCGVILAVNAGVSPSHLAMTRQTSVEHIIRIVSEFNERGLSSVEDSQ